MIPVLTVLSFSLVVLLGAMTPGPDFLIMVRSSLAGGRLVGAVCALGISCGVFVWVMAIALGVAGLLATSAVAFTVVKLVGAAYLCYLGIRAWWSVRRGGYEQLATSERKPLSYGAGFRQGLLCNLLNPKVAMFFLALIPQFLPSTAPVGQTVELALVATGVSLAWWTVFAMVVGTLRRFFSTARVRRAMDAIMGTFMIGLGLRVATQLS